MNVASRLSGRDTCEILHVKWLSAWRVRMSQALINQRCAFFHEAWVLFYNVHVVTKNLPVEETCHVKSLTAFKFGKICGEQL